MSIPEEYHFDKAGEVVQYPGLRKYFLTLLIALIALLSFGIGRLTGSDRAGVTIHYPEGQIPPQAQLASVGLAAQATPQAPQAAGQVYASSKGTRYYYNHCKSTVSKKNKIVFATPAEAEAAGYTLALTCKP